MSKTAIISLIVIGILSAAIPVAVYLVKQQQTVSSRAEAVPTPTPAGGTCTPPSKVDNVRIEYPNCVQGANLQCSFTEANCSWDTVSGAANYNVKITDLDTSTVVKTETIASSTTKIVFPVISGRTYQCDVTAVNSCGATGGTGTDSLLCKVDAVFGSPSPTPSPTPSPSQTPPPRVPSPSPSPIPTPLPSPVPSPSPVQVTSLTCGYTQCNQPNVVCQSGLVCITLTNGNSACSMPAYQQSCKQNPTLANCCQAPPAKVLPKGGEFSPTVILGTIGIGLAIVGGILLWL